MRQARYDCSQAVPSTADIFTIKPLGPTYMAKDKWCHKETNLSEPKPAACDNEPDGWLQTRPGERCFIRVPASQTDKIYSMCEITSEPGDATPLHIHANEDEYFIVLGRADENRMWRSRV